MSFEGFLGLFIAMVVVAVIPGPAVLTITTASVTGGFKRGLYMTIGLVLADYIFIILAILGLSHISELMGEAFIYVKYVCAAYLIWLGIGMWRAKPAAVGTSKRINSHNDVLAGLLLTLSNPKAILFYVALFPAFVTLHSVRFFDMLAILACATLAFGSVNLAYSYLASHLSKSLNANKQFPILQKVAGTIMASAGISVAIQE
ncbi:threonine transporter RhtB [Pseudoalteromonas sp. A25]|uniref:LysE family translocator n=1 Tax=Pseudoalteromonas sp. A25 TaxID=116092 RepID=UPI001260B10D|nr:LysE family translocator [Pseudoalteromonas sp. A25]BBN83344.1 threonine transporter RhtB [Pseudoalteromonas sp. A25]